MEKMFSELLMRIDNFLFTDSKEFTADEKAVMNTVLSDFKGSIKSGQYRYYYRRKNSVKLKVCELILYNGHLMYLKWFKNSCTVKSLKYSKIGFDNIKSKLEGLGFTVELSRYGDISMKVFFTVPGGADP